MKTNSTYSTNKIIVLVVFVCAAIMTSVFVYNWREQAARSVIALDNGSVFPAPRPIKSFELTSTNQKWTQKNLLGHWSLLFFGFTHCSNVCPTTLDMMKQAYAPLQKAIPNLQVVLISLDPERDTPNTVNAYAKSYHDAFQGVTGNMQELRKLQSQFKIFSARDPEPNTNYQIQHTSSILLVNPKGEWVGLLHYGMNPQEFVKEVKQSVDYLT